MSRTTLFLIIGSLVLALQACGFKGPLTLPDKAPTAQQQEKK